MDPFLDIRNDFRLDFLKERFGCRTKCIFQAYTPSFWHRLFSFIVCELPYWKLTAGLRLISKIAQRLARRAYCSSWREQLYDTGWAKRFLQEHHVVSLVIDWGKVHRFIYKSLSDAADELGVRKVGVPHGMNLMANDDWSTKFVVAQRLPDLREEYGWLDELVVQAHPIREKYIRGGFPPERLRILGSARFCREWMEVYRRILPHEPLPGSDGRLKIVYMDHDKSYRLNTQDIVNSFQAVAQMDFVKLVIKKSTRTPLSDESLRYCGEVDVNTSSVHLIRWADVVISTISSIVLEVLDQKKIFIFPTYFTDNEMLFEQYGACWAVSNKDELLSALRSIHQGSYQLPYSDSNVQAFQAEVVYGGNLEADVLSNYVDYIVAPGTGCPRECREVEQ